MSEYTRFMDYLREHYRLVAESGWTFEIDSRFRLQVLHCGFKAPYRADTDDFRCTSCGGMLSNALLRHTLTEFNSGHFSDRCYICKSATERICKNHSIGGRLYTFMGEVCYPCAKRAIEGYKKYGAPDQEASNNKAHRSLFLEL